MPKDKPVGIGPLIAGWDEGTPVYYFCVVLPDGSIRRVMKPKRTHRADRVAKGNAIWERAVMIRDNRPGGLVVTHDAASFDALVSCLASRQTEQQAA